MKIKTLLAVSIALALGLLLPALALAIYADLDVSGVVDDADMGIVYAAYNSHSWNPVSPNWDARADIDRNGRVNLRDLTLAGLDYGSDFNFTPRRRINTALPTTTACLVNEIDAAVDSRGRIHVVFRNDENDPAKFYYTQLDFHGNTFVSPILIDNHMDDPRLAVDSEDNAHIVWYGDASSYYSVWYTKLNKDGETLVAPRPLCPSGKLCSYPVAVAVDSLDHPHVVFLGPNENVLYNVLDSNGNYLLDRAELNTQRIASTEAIRPFMGIGPGDVRHVFWLEYNPDPAIVADFIYTRIPYGELPDPNQQPVAQLLGSYNIRRQWLAIDSQGAVHLLYRDGRKINGVYKSLVLWKRINPDGSLSEEKIISDQVMNEAPLRISMAIDAQDHIHYVTRTSNQSYIGYGRIDRDGNTLIPFTNISWEYAQRYQLVAAPDGRVALLLTGRFYSGGSDCYPLYFTSTDLDPAALDASRADLVIDAPHTFNSPVVVRINQDETITTTVFNHGHAAAQDVTLHFTNTATGEQIIPPVALGTIQPFSSVTVVRRLPVPDLEDATLLHIRLAARSSTSETTLENNDYDLPVGVLPPLHAFDVGVAVFDETFSPDDREQAAPLVGARLQLQSAQAGYSDEITSTQAYNGFLHVPLHRPDPQGPPVATRYELTLSKPGFSTATQVFTADRPSSDPYRVEIDPAPLLLYLNQWGEIAGKVYTGTSGSTPLPGAKITLDGGQSVTALADGSFGFTRVYSGVHTLDFVRAGNEPQSLQVQVVTGQSTDGSAHLPGTTRGVVRGRITDALGQPLANATVRLKSGAATLQTTVSDENGDYSFTVDPASQCAACTVFASLGGQYRDDESGVFALQAGIPRVEDLTLLYTTTTGVRFFADDAISWQQREVWNKVDDDGLPVGLWIQEKIARLKNYFQNYEVDVNWGAYHLSFAMDFQESGGVYTVKRFGWEFTPGPLTDYDVSSGRWHSGGTSTQLTALRVERVDLVQVDSSGNVVTGGLWKNKTLKYVCNADGSPVWSGVYDINRSVSSWPQAAIRVFVRVGGYQDPSHGDPCWEPWAPPAGNFSLAGSGSGVGADYQVLIWRLNANEVERLMSMAYYQYYLDSSAPESGEALDCEPGANSACPAAMPASPPLGGGLEAALETGEAASTEMNLVEPESLFEPAGEPGAPLSTSGSLPLAPAAVSFSLQPASSAAPRVGIPFPVDLLVSGASAAPVRSAAFALQFDPQVLQLQSIVSGEGFEGAAGAWVGLPPLAQVNASGLISPTAVIPLGAGAALADGALARLTFLPIQPADSTLLDLQSLDYDTLAGSDPLSAGSSALADLASLVRPAVVFCPLVAR